VPVHGSPNGVPAEALAAGAITLCITGTDQAIPPTMPAFLRKSRREEERASGVADVLEAVV
jgi:hypothetical protein